MSVRPELTEQVRAWLVAAGEQPDEDALRRCLRDLGVIAETSVLDELGQRLRHALVGAGVLQPLLQRPGVTDVLVNGTTGVWVDEGGGLVRSDIGFADEADVRRLAQRLAAQAGRRLDNAQPFVDARLPDGTRLHAALAPVAAPGTLISLRIPADRVFSVDTLVAGGSIPESARPWLLALVHARVSYLVCGGTGSGKTTLLRALLEHVPADERVLVLEESAELRPAHPHCIRLEGRPANAELAGSIGLPDLLRQAMRMRPDRIVVGEVRGAEVTQLLAAMNTGHEGCCGTIHANDAAGVPARIEALALAGGLDRDAVHSQICAGLEVVVGIDRDRDGTRRVTGLSACENVGGRAVVRPLVTFRRPRVLVHDPVHPVVRRLGRALRP